MIYNIRFQKISISTPRKATGSFEGGGGGGSQMPKFLKERRSKSGIYGGVGGFTPKKKTSVWGGWGGGVGGVGV